MRIHRSIFVLGIVLSSGFAACSSDDGGVASPGLDASVGDGNTTTPPEGDGATDAGADVDAYVDPWTSAEHALAHTLSPLPAVPPDTTNKYADSAAAAVLGQRFFFDKAFSGPITVAADGTNGGLGAIAETGKVACVDCHASAATTDNRSKPGNVSLGTAYGTRNALNIENSAFYGWTNWAGRFDSQWSLPTAVVENATIMNSTRLDLAHLIFAKYRADYDALFTTDPLDPDLDPTSANASRFPASGKPAAAGAPPGAWEGMAADDQKIVNRILANFGKAIQAYVRLVVSRNAPFDKFVAGDVTAMGADAIRGFKVFASSGCVSCHSGPLFSDSSFHAEGVPQTGAHVPATDLGRFQDVPALLASPFTTAGAYSDDPAASKLTGLAQTTSQLGQFRTKSLRGLTNGAPYMHDGVFTTLEEVVSFYVSADGGTDGGWPADAGVIDPLLKPVALSASEQTDLIAFLRSLDGEPPPPNLLTAP